MDKEEIARYSLHGLNAVVALLAVVMMTYAARDAPLPRYGILIAGTILALYGLHAIYFRAENDWRWEGENFWNTPIHVAFGVLCILVGGFMIIGYLLDSLG